MERLELRELGSSVGWVEFDPYQYEYSGDSKDAESVLEDGPPDTVRVGDMPPEEFVGMGVRADRVQETTVEERRDIMMTNLSRVGVIVKESEDTA